MDTLLKPRPISETESEDGSDSDSLSDYPAPLNPRSKNGPVEEETCSPEAVSVTEGKVFVSPTARFLNDKGSKKISSYDLLVQPPKRRRVATPSSQNLASDQRKASSVSHPPKDVPVNSEFQDIYIGGTGKCNSSLSQVNSGIQRLGVVRKDDDKDLPGSGQETRNNNESGHKSLTWKTFPTTQFYSYYVSVPNLKNSSASYQTVNEKDKNRNILSRGKSPRADNKSHGSLFSGPGQGHSSTVNVTPSTTPISKTKTEKPIKNAVYRLRGLIGNDKPAEFAYLKETDYFPALLQNLKYLDATMSQPFKRRKFNRAGEFPEENEVFNSEKFPFLFKMCNEMTKESEILSLESPILPLFVRKEEILESASEQASASHSTSTPGGEEPKLSFNKVTNPVESSGTNETFIINSNENPETDSSAPSFGNTFYHDPFLESVFTSPNMGFFNDSSEIYTETSLQDSMTGGPYHSQSHASSMHQTPFTTIFVHQDPADCGNEDFHCHNPDPFIFDSLPFPIFSAKSQSQFSEESRIEDVTETDEFANFEVVDGKMVEIETIFQSNPNDLRFGPESTCGSIQEGALFQNDKNDTSTRENLVFKERSSQETQETLVQPAPHLNYSTSFHSQKAGGISRTDTMDRFIQKKTKSDYFVGKLAGLTKSIMKLQRKVDTETPEVNEELEYNANVKIENSTKSETKELQSIRENSVSSESNDDDDININNNGPSPSNCKPEALPPTKTPVPLMERESVDDTKLIFKKQEKRSKKKKKSQQSKESEGKAEKNEKDLRSQSKMKPAPTLKSAVVAPLKVVQKEKSRISNSIKKNDKSTTSILRSKSTTLPKNAEPSKKSSKSDGGIFFPLSSIFKLFLRMFKKRKRKESSKSQAKVNPANHDRLAKDNLRIDGNGPISLVQHTDSKELYKSRRRRFFKEQKEFHDESLRSYLESLVEAGMAFHNTKSKVAPEPADVLIPIRRATSENTVSTKKSIKSTQLHLQQLPPIVKLLATKSQAQKVIFFGENSVASNQVSEIQYLKDLRKSTTSKK